jgi:uncharacterized protein (DUF697 family)
MPFGIGIRQAIGVVRETRGLEGPTAQIALSGPGAGELAVALAAGGDPGAVSVDGDPLRATVAIRLVEGEPSAAELAVLRLISRAGTPLIVVRRGGAEPIWNVYPEDVLEVAGPEVSIAALASAIARAAPDAAPSLAARLPLLRPAVARRLIATTALANAAIAASPWQKQAHLPLLTLAQIRMVLRLGLSRGDVLPRDPQDLAAAAGPAFAGSLGVGLGARALVRRLPIRGPLVRAAVAYAGTRALGAARLRL